MDGFFDEVTPEQAAALIKHHKTIVEKAELLQSYDYYPAEQIAGAENLVPKETKDEDDIYQ